MGYLETQWQRGRKIYGKRSWRETRRTFLHTMRSIRNKREIEALENYFASYTPDPTLLDRQVGLFELMTRYFLFKSSTPQERLEAIINHFDYLKDVFTDEAIREMYSVDPDNIYDDVSRMNRGFIVWESEDLDMVARLYYGPGQRKEGFWVNKAYTMLTSALVKVLMGNLLCGLARFKDIKMALIMLKQLLKRCLGIDQKTLLCSYYAILRSFVRSNRFMPYLMKDSMQIPI